MVFTKPVVHADFVESFEIRQTFWGFIFNFGHMEVENPFSKNNIKLLFVNNPKKRASEIRHLKENALRDRPFTKEGNVFLAQYK